MYHSLREKVVFATDFAKSREMTTPQRRYTPCSNHQAIALDGGYVDEKSQFSMRTPCFLCEARDFSVYVLNIYSPGIMKFRNSIICARIIITIYCLWSFRYPCRKCSRYYYYFFFFWRWTRRFFESYYDKFPSRNIRLRQQGGGGRKASSLRWVHWKYMNKSSAISGFILVLNIFFFVFYSAVVFFFFFDISLVRLAIIQKVRLR